MKVDLNTAVVFRAGVLYISVKRQPFTVCYASGACGISLSVNIDRSKFAVLQLLEGSGDNIWHLVYKVWHICIFQKWSVRAWYITNKCFSVTQDYNLNCVLKKAHVLCQQYVSFSHLVLQACTEDEVIIGHLPKTRHQDVLGLPVDAHHLPSHHIDAGMQGQLGQVSAAVCVTAGSRDEDTWISNHLSLSSLKTLFKCFWWALWCFKFYTIICCLS